MLFFLLAWNQVQKILQMEQKMFENKLFSTTNKTCSDVEQKMSANKICSKSIKKKLQKERKIFPKKTSSNWTESHDFKMASSDLLLNCMVLYDLVWHFMVLFGFSWSCMAFLWSCLPFYGLLWQNIDLIGLKSSFLAVIDPNSFGQNWFLKVWVRLTS